jgi:dTDP-4-dehydrorhamnose reductase
MKVLITGAGGMLGSDVMLAAENAGHEVTGYDHSGLDVTGSERLRRRMNIDRPDMVINCAAWTDVDGAESQEQQAFEVNATGAGNVAAAAEEAGSKVLHVSTDYVFNGGKSGPYVETDLPAPLSAYGRSKLAGEQATVEANRRSFVVRTAGLFGIGGPNFVDTMLRLGQGGEVLVVHDQVSSPTYTWHLAYGLIRLLDSDAFGLHHMAAAGSCTWYEFAREIFECAGMEVATMGATSEMLARPAARPANSALASQNQHAIELPTWQDGLTSYLAQRGETEKVVSE